MMESGPRTEATEAAIYERAMGRWSRRLARVFLDFAQPRACRQLIDVGCGTGSLALTAAVRFPECQVVGIDSAEVYLTDALHNAAPNATFRCCDAAALPDADGAFDASLSLLVLNELPDPYPVVREMVRVAAPGGVVASAVWDRAGGMPFLRLFLDTASAFLGTEAEALRTRLLDVRLRSEEDLLALWSEAGLYEVRTSTLTVRMEFLDFQDYWGSILAAVSDIAALVSSLPADQAAMLQAAVRRAYYGGGQDGRRSMVAAALAVRGLVKA